MDASEAATPQALCLPKLPPSEQTAPTGWIQSINALPCTSGATIYKGKYLDQTLDTDIGPVKARIWDRGVDVSNLEALWWRESECAITSPEKGAGAGAGDQADAA